MKTIIAGSRGATIEDVWSAMDECPWEVTSVVSGGARGADQAGEMWADMEGLECTVIPANWDAHGPPAGHIRNRVMASVSEACVVVWDGKSRGSKNMIDEAKNASLKRLIWHFEVKKDG